MPDRMAKRRTTIALPDHDEFLRKMQKLKRERARG